MVCIVSWRDAYNGVKAAISKPTPEFIARVGGSDTNAVAAFMKAKADGVGDVWGQIWKHRAIVERYNGYYDLDKKGETFWNYLSLLAELYTSHSELFFCNHQLLSIFFPENVSEDFRNLKIDCRQSFEHFGNAVGANDPAKNCYPYTMVEKLVSMPFTLMKVFQETLPGKIDRS